MTFVRRLAVIGSIVFVGVFQVRYSAETRGDNGHGEPRGKFIVRRYASSSVRVYVKGLGQETVNFDANIDWTVPAGPVPAASRA